MPCSSFSLSHWYTRTQHILTQSHTLTYSTYAHTRTNYKVVVRIEQDNSYDTTWKTAVGYKLKSIIFIMHYGQCILQVLLLSEASQYIGVAVTSVIK